MRKPKLSKSPNRKQLQKKKDPKKVAAGKARAAKAIRIDGKYASKEFVEVLKKDAELAGVKPDKVFEFFLQNEKEYIENAEMFKLTTFRNYEQIRTDLKNYKGTIIYNGRKVKKATAILNLSMLNQYLITEHEFYTFWCTYEKKINGQIKLTVPTIKQIKKMIEEEEMTIDEIMKEKKVKFIRNTSPNAYTPSERRKIKRKNAKSKI